MGGACSPVIPHRQNSTGRRKNSTPYLGISSGSRTLQSGFAGGCQRMSERRPGGHRVCQQKNLLANSVFRGDLGARIRHAGMTTRAASHPDCNRRYRNFTGSATQYGRVADFTAGSDFHRPRSTRLLCHIFSPFAQRAWVPRICDNGASLENRSCP